MAEEQKKMKYFINGVQQEASNKTTLQSILSGNNEFKEDSIISLNGTYVTSKKEFESILISEGDKIEVIKLLSGG